VVVLALGIAAPAFAVGSDGTMNSGVMHKGLSGWMGM
jgi:hypothetical protein